jgi:hypothetical protein
MVKTLTLRLTVEVLALVMVPIAKHLLSDTRFQVLPELALITITFHRYLNTMSISLPKTPFAIV